MLGGRRDETDLQDDLESQPEEGVVTASGLQQVLMTDINLMREHQQDMLAQQRQQFAQLMKTLMMVRRGAQAPSIEPVVRTAAVTNGATVTEPVLSTGPSSRTLSTPRLPESGAQGCPVKWLAAQIR